MLLLQCTRDSLANPKPLRPVREELGKNARLHLIDRTHHSFHVPKSSGRMDSDAFDEVAGTVAEWGKNLRATERFQSR